MPEQTASPWLPTKAAAVYANRHWKTVLAAVQAKTLHAVQQNKYGRWSIHREDLDHWLAGGSYDTAPQNKATSIRVKRAS